MIKCQQKQHTPNKQNNWERRVVPKIHIYRNRGQKSRHLEGEIREGTPSLIVCLSPPLPTSLHFVRPLLQRSHKQEISESKVLPGLPSPPKLLH